MDVIIHALLTSGLNGGERSVSRSGYLEFLIYKSEIKYFLAPNRYAVKAHMGRGGTSPPTLNFGSRLYDRPASHSSLFNILIGKGKIK
jgi:hypothetical protein